MIKFFFLLQFFKHRQLSSKWFKLIESYIHGMQKWCKACVLLEGLNRGLPKLGIGRSRVVNGDVKKEVKQDGGTKSIESKQCGTLDF